MFSRKGIDELFEGMVEVVEFQVDVERTMHWFRNVEANNAVGVESASFEFTCCQI